MKTKRKTTIARRLGLFTGLGLALGLLSLNWAQSWRQAGNPVVDALLLKLESVLELRAEERTYLQIDKPFYLPGETIWFNAFLLEASTMRPSTTSGIVHVELLAPNGSVAQSRLLLVEQGSAPGQFEPAADAPGGIYTLKAYTRWQKNEGEEHGFSRQIQVQQSILPNLKMRLDFEREAYGPGEEVVAELRLEDNQNRPLANHSFSFEASADGQRFFADESACDAEGIMFLRFQLPEDPAPSEGLLNVRVLYQGRWESISRSIPILTQGIRLEFFPEGGDMVEGMNNRLAFRAFDSHGEPADIAGKVYDQDGIEQASFSSFHQGMGAFALKPIPGKRYHAVLTHPMGIDLRQELPEALPQGYTLAATRTPDGLTRMRVGSTQAEVLTLVGQVRGQVFYQRAIGLRAGETLELDIDWEKAPMGVAQFTLFDSRGVERAERLVMANPHQQLRVDISTDKEQYLPGEQVRMSVRVSDHRGVPMPATLALSVVDDQLLSFADDHSSHMVSWMMLEADLREEVYEPDFYFDPEEEKAPEALDLLLMTSGWRRFRWEELASVDLSPDFAPEKAIVTGQIVGYEFSDEPAAGALLRVGDREFKTDANGRFALEGIDLRDPTSLTVRHPDHGERTFELTSYENTAPFVLNDLEVMEEEIGAVWFDAPVRGNGAFRNAVPAMAGVPAVQAPPPMLAQDRDEAAAGEMPMPEVLQAEAIVMDDLIRVEDRRREDANVVRPVASERLYQRAREFPKPAPRRPESPRSDFRTTVFWQQDLRVGANGKAELSFLNNDKVSSFRITAEGFGAGMVGRGEQRFFTQLPFALRALAPAELVVGDELWIPITLTNNTPASLEGKLELELSPALRLISPLPERQQLAAGENRVLYAKCEVKQATDSAFAEIGFEADGLSDAYRQEMRTIPRGFPAQFAFSGKEMSRKLRLRLSGLLDGSLAVRLVAFPSIITDLLAGVESILREPSGCFEQTSVSSYPNLLVMRYLQETEADDPVVLARAERLMESGYGRLTQYETPEKGYEWFGGAPGHEALTAYGLMQFSDMSGVVDYVDPAMIERTQNWLLARRDGQGGFERNPRALDTYGGASPEITNAYIVYALCESGSEQLDAELAASHAQALASADPYLWALVANAQFSRGNRREGQALLAKLLDAQQPDGSINGTSHSVTRSTGHSLKVETTALAVMAMLKSPNAPLEPLAKGVDFLIAARGGSGDFGSTQGTILALKALTEFARFSKRTEESGVLQVFVGGRLVEERAFAAGHNQPIAIDGLERHLADPEAEIELRFKGCENPLPYTLSAEWTTNQPNSQEDCAVRVSTRLDRSQITVGQTVRLTTTLRNTRSEGLPTTMAIVGLPAGLAAQPWQLKELQEKQVVDYYETRGNNLFFYLRDMAPGQSLDIVLDLKAEVPGSFEAPASSAYLYYTNELKQWDKPQRVTILP